LLGAGAFGFAAAGGAGTAPVGLICAIAGLAAKAAVPASNTNTLERMPLGSSNPLISNDNPHDSQLNAYTRSNLHSSNSDPERHLFRLT
jgi:hypothetical protein